MKAKYTERTDRRGIALAMGTFESLGFAFREQSASDYGIDGHAERIDSEHPTGRLLGIQIKTGASYLSERTATAIVFRADADHVSYWLNHALPVVICLCDVDNETIYWQAVSNETAVSTGKGYRFDVPLSQVLDAEAVPQLIDLLTPLVSPERYTIFKTEDVSHGLAKRYSLEIVVNGTASKAEVAAIVRQVTAERAKRRYHRSHMVEGRWADSDAHVVWTFIYPSAEDHKRRNHTCRSIWIHGELKPEFRAIGFDGENVGDNIIVDWSTNYKCLAEHVSTNTLSKEEYFSEVLPRIEELKTALASIEGHLLAVANRNIDEPSFLAATASERARINELYFELTDLPFAPFECRDMDAKLQSFVAFLHNIWLFYSDDGRTKWDERSRLEQSLQQRWYARETLQHLEYELSKVR